MKKKLSMILAVLMLHALSAGFCRGGVCDPRKLAYKQNASEVLI